MTEYQAAYERGFTKGLMKAIADEAGKVVVGHYELVEKLTIILLMGGHALIEGVPGLAKTLAARTMSRVVRAEFKRIQFTPDLMPADITGTNVYDSKTGNFYFRKGPLFTNLLLADEINRTPPKTQAALLESMEERSVTIGGETHSLAEPFMVIATQNPVEYEGTYPLPEAQLDRFMMKLLVDYVPQKFENAVLEKYNQSLGGAVQEMERVNPVATFEDLKKSREEIRQVKVDGSIIHYITSVIRATRSSNSLILGASPRASISLLLASKAYAAIQGRDFVTPEDIKDLALPVLRHRVILKPEAGMEGLKGDDIIRNILSRVEVPR